jgi:PAS domain S-box-containing protein
MQLALRISALYWILSALWILLSDYVLLESPRNAAFVPSSLKGFAFVSVTALLLYFLLRAAFRKQEFLHRQAQAAQMDFRFLFMQNPLPMFIYDLETYQFLDVNEAAVRHYGYPRAEFLSMNARDIHPPEELPRMLEYLRRIGNALEGAGEWRHQRKDGQIMDMDMTSLTFTYNGRPAVLGIGRDITDQKKARAAMLEQDQLRLALDKEMELRNVRNRFISMVSHEFRSPLASISTSLDLLDHYGERLTPENRKTRIAHMHEQMRELTQLLDEVLILMKTDTVGMEFKAEQVDVVALCKGILDETRQNDSREHLLTFTTTAQDLSLQSDPKLLRFALRNLVSNAVKYSPAKSAVSLDLSRSDAEIAIRISDQGIGIPEAEQKYIFDAFFRATNAHDISGTGLGLAITKQAVDLHGGSIDLQSGVGEGTTFTIKLPLQTA